MTQKKQFVYQDTYSHKFKNVVKLSFSFCNQSPATSTHIHERVGGFFTSRKNINTLFASPGGFMWRNILDQFFLRHFPFDKLTNDWRSRWTAFVPKNSPPSIPYTNWICMSELTCAEGHRLRVVPHFSSGIVERAKRKRAWKSPHARKGDTCRHVLISAACNFKNNVQESRISDFVIYT